MFKAKTCSDVHVGLARYAGISNVEMNEVVIGGWNNTQSVIRKGPQNDGDRAELQTPDILSCTEYRFFWIYWDDHVISVGKGSRVFDDEFLRWYGPGVTKHVSALSFTNAAGWSGTWQLNVGNGMSLSNNLQHTA